MLQLILHLVGDYLTQSHWMAENKTKSSSAAFIHALVYSLPFWICLVDGAAFLVILTTHFLIDRYRLAKYVVYAKNIIGGEVWKIDAKDYQKQLDHLDRWCWDNCKDTGYPADVPPWLAVWLLIAADQTLHLVCNFLAIKFL